MLSIHLNDIPVHTVSAHTDAYSCVYFLSVKLEVVSPSHASPPPLDGEGEGGSQDSDVLGQFTEENKQTQLGGFSKCKHLFSNTTKQAKFLLSRNMYSGSNKSINNENRDNNSTEYGNTCNLTPKCDWTNFTCTLFEAEIVVVHHPSRYCSIRCSVPCNAFVPLQHVCGLSVRGAHRPHQANGDAGGRAVQCRPQVCMCVCVLGGGIGI